MCTPISYCIVLDDDMQSLQTSTQLPAKGMIILIRKPSIQNFIVKSNMTNWSGNLTPYNSMKFHTEVMTACRSNWISSINNPILQEKPQKQPNVFYTETRKTMAMATQMFTELHSWDNQLIRFYKNNDNLLLLKTHEALKQQKPCTIKCLTVISEISILLKYLGSS